MVIGQLLKAQESDAESLLPRGAMGKLIWLVASDSASFITPSNGAAASRTHLQPSDIWRLQHEGDDEPDEI